MTYLLCSVLTAHSGQLISKKITERCKVNLFCKAMQ